MKIYDAHLRSDTRSEDDLRNLRYFDTERVVTTAHPHRAFETADDLLAYFDSLVSDETARLERCGLEAGVALGVSPGARPERRHPEVWDGLADRLGDPRVVAVGEIGARADQSEQWQLFERQVEMAVAAELPVVVTPPSERRVNLTYKMMMHAEQVGAVPQTVLMNYLDARTLVPVLRDGFTAGVAIGEAGIAPDEAARIVAEAFDELGTCEGIVLSSALRAGSSDVLGIPKTLTALEDDYSVPSEVMHDLAYRNAARFYESD